MRWLTIFFILLTSCHKVHYLCEEEFFNELVVDQVYSVPQVRLVPIFNSSAQETPWNVSQELTELMKEINKSQDMTFVVDETERWLTFEEACQGIQNGCSIAEFVALANLLQHSIIPMDNQSACPSALIIKMRLVIFDLRGASPKPIYDQTICNFHPIPQEYDYWNYGKYHPQNPHYRETPLSDAHRHLAGVLMANIEKTLENGY